MQQLKNDYDQAHYRYYSNLFEGIKPKVRFTKFEFTIISISHERFDY
jgi:hypothetical protein